MTSINEITVFTLGDSSKLSTWSNVPYFFTCTLADKGVRVNRVDLSAGMLGRAIGRVMRWVGQGLKKDSTYDYSRSLLYHASVKRRIRQALARHPNADANIFLTFSFSSAGMSDKPCVLFGDWTYDHCFKHFLHREPGTWERASLDREDREIEAADLVFVLFPSVAEGMRQRYRNPNIHYVGNVVNSLRQVDARQVLERKLASQRLLFIGSRKYIEGARHLLRAFEDLKPAHPLLELHIVGMRKRDLAPLPAGVFCHGYLDKQVDSDRERYYDLLLSARAIVNTTPKWAAFSAMIEAMYFYTPAVVTPYEEFVKTFGATIDFGFYCPEDAPQQLTPLLRTLLDDAGYVARCSSAHDAVKDYSWGAYIDRLLADIARCASTRNTPSQGGDAKLTLT